MKVLIISHNCFSATQSMGKTLASFFGGFDNSEVMQLYLYPSLPNIKKYDNYFRITDKDVLKSIFKRKKCGRKILPEEIKESNELFESSDQAQTYGDINRKSDLVRRARDFVWSIGCWKTRELIEWLEQGKPDVVFYALGDAVFSQNIAMWAADYLDIPLVTYVCDEFYFTFKNGSLKNKLINGILIKNIAKIQRKAKLSATICESLGEVYKKEFGTPYITVMTGSSFEAQKSKAYLNSKEISYIGNLGLERWLALGDIQDTVTELNGELGTDYKLVYYGNKCNELEGKVEYGGRLSSDEVKQKMLQSFLLVHTETFNKEYTERLRYSVSTKIADSLASGTPLLAYCPEELASAQHLIKNNCAVCITRKDLLKPMLGKIFAEPESLENICENAYNTSVKCHNAGVSSQELKDKLGDLVVKNK